MWFLIVPLCLALTPQEDASIRSAFLATPTAPVLVAIIDARLPSGVAYTSSDLRRIYVDFWRLRFTPKTRQNVLRHELAHTTGASHGDGSSLMSYAVRQDSAGNILEDSVVLT